MPFMVTNKSETGEGFLITPTSHFLLDELFKAREHMVETLSLWYFLFVSLQ